MGGDRESRSSSSREERRRQLGISSQGGVTVVEGPMPGSDPAAAGRLARAQQQELGRTRGSSGRDGRGGVTATEGPAPRSRTPSILRQVEDRITPTGDSPGMLRAFPAVGIGTAISGVMERVLGPADGPSTQVRERNVSDDARNFGRASMEDRDRRAGRIAAVEGEVRRPRLGTPGEDSGGTLGASRATTDASGEDVAPSQPGTSLTPAGRGPSTLLMGESRFGSGISIRRRGLRSTLGGA